MRRKKENPNDPYEEGFYHPGTGRKINFSYVCIEFNLELVNSSRFTSSTDRFFLSTIKHKNDRTEKFFWNSANRLHSSVVSLQQISRSITSKLIAI